MSEWKDPKKELPKPFKRVLIWERHNGVTGAYLTYDNEWYINAWHERDIYMCMEIVEMWREIDTPKIEEEND